VGSCIEGLLPKGASEWPVLVRFHVIKNRHSTIATTSERAQSLNLLFVQPASANGRVKIPKLNANYIHH
jgi:hypothetical protein